MKCPSGFSVLRDEDACRKYATTEGLKMSYNFKDCFATEVRGCFNDAREKSLETINFSTCNESFTDKVYAAVCTKGDFLVHNMYIYNSSHFIHGNLENMNFIK